MKPLTWVLVLLSVLVLRATGQLPAPPSSGPYLIPAGDYNMTADMFIDVNATGVIAGSCTPGTEPCVTIDLQGFSFSLSSANASAALVVSGIQFTGGLHGQAAALNLTARIAAVTLLGVVHENSSAALLAGIPPNGLSLANVQFYNNTAYKMVDLYCDNSLSAIFWSMGVITIDSVFAQDNFGPSVSLLKRDGNTPRNTSYISLFSFIVDSIDVVNITNSNFINNANVLVSGDSPTGIYPNGITVLNIHNCSFEEHVDPAYPIILQTTTTSGSGSWNVTSSRLLSNRATFIQVLSTSGISVDYSNYIVGIGFVNNVFDRNEGLTFWGALQNGAYFANNIYTHGSGSFVTYECVICTNPTTTVILSNETYDFDLTDVERPLLQFSGLQSVLVRNSVFKNIAPSNITAIPSVLSFSGVSSVTVANTAFQNVSFTTNNATFAAHIMMDYDTPNNFVANLKIQNVSFGQYDPEDSTTAEIAQNINPSDSGTLILSGYTNPAKPQLLNLTRLALCGNANITSSQLEVQEKLYNPITDRGLASIYVASRLFVQNPLLVEGRIVLTLGGAVNFTFTPTMNGTIELKGTNNFVPAVDASAALFTVDLGSGLTVPVDSEYTLITNGINVLPLVSPIAMQDGSVTNAFFTGVLALTDVSTDSTYTYGDITLVATPQCSISCIKGACLYRQVCVCENGWSGTACTCLQQGRPAGAQCTNSLTSFQWVTSTPQTLAPSATLAIPDQLTYFVNSDFTVAGTLTLTSTSSLVVYGNLTINGTVMVSSTAANYAGSCDVFIPNAIQAGSLSIAPSASIQVALDTSGVSVCPAGQKKEVTVYDSLDNYNVLIAANETIGLNGSVTINAPYLQVPAGRQQELFLVSTTKGNLSDTALSGSLTVTATLPSVECSYEHNSPQLLSLFVSPCNGEIVTTQWWWYGAPVIGIGFLIFVMLALTIAVPSWRQAIFPWTAKAAKE